MNIELEYKLCLYHTSMNIELEYTLCLYHTSISLIFSFLGNLFLVCN